MSHYKFDGNANDSASSNHGIEMGYPGYVAGVVGTQAIDLDGFNDYVETYVNAADLGVDDNNPRTITAWVYTRGFNNAGIYEVGQHSNGRDFSLRTLGEPNRWRIQHWGYGAGFDMDFTYDSMSKWIHFAHVYDGPKDISDRPMEQ